MLLSYALNPTHSTQSLADVAAPIRSPHPLRSPRAQPRFARWFPHCARKLKRLASTAFIKWTWRLRRCSSAWNKPACASISASSTDSPSASPSSWSVSASTSSSLPDAASTSTPQAAWRGTLYSSGSARAIQSRQRQGRLHRAGCARVSAEKHEVPRLVLEFRHLSKLKSTYIDALPLLADADSRVHTTFQAAAVATGRLSSINPISRTFPSALSWAAKFAPRFTAAPGTQLLSADYSQIELRLLAHFSGDPLLVHAYQNNEDIHTLTASEVFGVLPAEMDKQTRNRAKAVNFGIVYGISPLAGGSVGIPQAEARAYIERYFARYSGAGVIEKTLEATRKTGSVRTLFGRVRPIPDIESRNPTSADSPNAPPSTRLAGHRSRPHQAGHDLHRPKLTSAPQNPHGPTSPRRVAFRGSTNESAEVEALVRAEMEGVIKLNVPLVADLAFGPNWRDL